MEITLVHKNRKKTIPVRDGDTLLTILQQDGAFVHAPCGGKGTCKKCSVHIEGIGDVLACGYKVSSPCTIILDSLDLAQSQILNSFKFDFFNVEIGSENSDLQIIKTSNFTQVLLNNEELFHSPGKLNQKILGLAIDIGTTTVVCYLEDLVEKKTIDILSFLNPQAVFGADVVSRILYTMQNENGLKIVQKSLLDKINESLTNLYKKHTLSLEQVIKITVVGNPTMLHILFGFDPSTIAQAPYTPLFTDAKTISAPSLGIQVNPKAFIHCAPSISGYVGADIIAGLGTLFSKENETSTKDLYIDIGTNGEMALFVNGVFYCCATAAGPAFEGARIQCGIGAVPGAITHFFQDQTFSTIENKAPVGFCGSGLVDIIAYLLDNGIVDSTGFMENEFVVVDMSTYGTNVNIIITPQDIREVQLAKAAIYAGIKVLLNHAKIEIDSIDKVYLAGGFGNYIDQKSALRIGLLPHEFTKKIIPVGNSAGAGARYMLHSKSFNKDLERIKEKCTYIELSTDILFNEEYFLAMQFPDEISAQQTV